MYHYRELHPFVNNDWVIILNPERLADKLRGNLVAYWDKKMWPQGSSSYPVGVYTLIFTNGRVIQLQLTGTEELYMEMNMVEAILARITIRQEAV